jgi:hypothetical protein
MKHYFAAIFLVIIGLSQLTGDVLNLPLLKIAGLVTHASPAPKVFTTQQGFETYSSNFYLDYLDNAEKAHSLHITPAVYKHIKGPYNRRNAYGAALSYAPVLYANLNTRLMLMSTLQYAFCKQTSLLKELGIDVNNAHNVQIRIVPRLTLPKNHSWKLNYAVDCKK